LRVNQRARQSAIVVQNGSIHCYDKIFSPSDGVIDPAAIGVPLSAACPRTFLEQLAKPATQFGSTRQNRAGRGDTAASNCADNSVLCDTGRPASCRRKQINRQVGSTHILYRDYETRSTLKLKAAGAWKYAADPHTEVTCCAYAVDDGQVTLWTPGNPQEDAEAMDFAKGPARGWLHIRTNKLGMMTQRLTCWEVAAWGYLESHLRSARGTDNVATKGLDVAQRKREER